MAEIGDIGELAGGESEIGHSVGDVHQISSHVIRRQLVHSIGEGYFQGGRLYDRSLIGCWDIE